jgi:hypothetical protein
VKVRKLVYVIAKATAKLLDFFDLYLDSLHVYVSHLLNGEVVVQCSLSGTNTVEQ